MSETTFKKINDYVKEIRGLLSKIKAKDYEGECFGPEKEFDARAVIEGAKAVLTDMAALIRSGKKCLQITTYQERSNIVGDLAELQDYVESHDLNKIVTKLNDLKPLLRSYGLRNSSARFEEFSLEISNLQILKGQLDERMEAIRVEQGEIESKLSEAVEKHNEAVELEKNFSATINSMNTRINSFNDAEENLKNIFDNADQISSELHELNKESEKQSDAINLFYKKIDGREAQLEKQEKKTQEYNETIENILEDNRNRVKEIEKIIAQAREALEYSTARGISAAFSEKYNEMKSGKAELFWVLGGAAFVLLAVAIGAWVFFDNEVTYKSILGRLSLVPILIAAAFFCASQFVKLNNIKEDYAFKSVLAKSLIGFSDQFSDNDSKGEEYNNFTRSLIAQIHRDPLGRKPIGGKINDKVGNIKTNFDQE
ncbi:hypothetical protein [Kushneria indalinina]|uniref:Uncharacterized protein n=1 Tax=Kushneria indalinina DSM 14324 TaxID=1122140 RepID=A0A3D9DVX4_9GAMM|nr:hypothetical protein [Kushneria indalinina]REC94933.1 hypothetical protein C8D72_1763 [Kushneria indalinina DSM 14324]